MLFISLSLPSRLHLLLRQPATAAWHRLTALAFPPSPPSACSAPLACAPGRRRAAAGARRPEHWDGGRRVWAADAAERRRQRRRGLLRLERLRAAKVRRQQPALRLHLLRIRAVGRPAVGRLLCEPLRRRALPHVLRLPAAVGRWGSASAAGSRTRVVPPHVGGRGKRVMGTAAAKKALQWSCRCPHPTRRHVVPVLAECRFCMAECSINGKDPHGALPT